MTDYAWIHSAEYCEDIEYFPDDLNYSNSIMGCGLLSGQPYTLTFDDDNKIESVELIEQ